ncbi:non-homologous end-joining DNA ligase [Saccharothrix australiensis]|uniref:Bifunctional non-homologous end joining protein LigD n=1 Tax=Saccharothrix australiensis TaxID=2072 RepID=A0A495VZW6_9PSEU|nr:non-homologous end-joining DNA ligase [Saccharothrix australiensis]RKT54981.1 bifunctional non-homologous end joining protein LigD [Saccharothrix australiensis]
MAGGDAVVRVGRRRVRLSNLGKVLYPGTGFTKAEVIDYYSRVAPVLLPHLAGRPLTVRRFPDGVEGQSFFGKNVPPHAPEWVRTVRVGTPGSSRGAEFAEFVVVDELATLVWLANLAALELHVPQWVVGAGGVRRCPDLVVFDLDPGEPATVVECCRVAERLREVLVGDGLSPVVKTSGSKGLQVYAAVRVPSAEVPSVYAKGLARRLARETPQEVVWSMAKALRRGKVLIDWSQNNPAKTTVAPYSLRARPVPSVSTPVTWAEVAACRSPGDLVFVAEEVLARVARSGDLFAVGGASPLPV